MSEQKSGYCSAHKHGEDKDCQICYPRKFSLDNIVICSGTPKESGQYIAWAGHGWFEVTYSHGKFITDIINPPDKNGSWRNEITGITHFFKANKFTGI